MKNKFISSVMNLAFLLIFSTSFTGLEAKHKKHTSIEMKILRANTRPANNVRVVERPILVPRPVVIERPVYVYREPVYVQQTYYQEPVIVQQPVYREAYPHPRPSFFNSFSFGFSFFN